LVNVAEKRIIKKVKSCIIKVLQIGLYIICNTFVTADRNQKSWSPHK